MKRINYCHPKSSMNPNDINFIEEVKENIKLVESIDWSKESRQSLKFCFSGYTNGKDLIRPLAEGSCAYCGDKITQATLVLEHYRPKNRLKARDNEFLITNGEFLTLNKGQTVSYYGYFIWGSHYKNLLPACRPCNTGEGNKEAVYINNSLNYSAKYGKDDYFPILYKKESRDRIYVRSIKNEYPLLFNPYKDNPNELFSYKIPLLNSFIKKEAIEIRPNKYASKNKRLKAELSINLLGLNRRTLCWKRWNIYNCERHIFFELVNDIDKKSLALSRCITYAKELCKLNCETNGTMHGFTKIHTKKTVKLLYNVISREFPLESRVVFTSTNSFKEKIKELGIFVANQEPLLDKTIENQRLNSILASYL
tara:strand:+ start:9704 stop:10804 length:1101 start_codon:yes stop_codon:yes gene_type:complete